MGSLAVSNKILDKYFGYLKDLDNKNKKRLIAKLSKSIQEKPQTGVNVRNLFGAWEDTRDSDEIIREIRASRLEKYNTKSLE